MLINIMRANKKYTFVFALFCVLVSCLYTQNRLVQLHLSSPQGQSYVVSMPWKDKQRLTSLFYQMMIRSSGAYTLFGCKPMHMGGYVKPLSIHFSKENSHSFDKSLSIFLMSIYPSNREIYLGWKTWEKYAYLLNDSKFSFWAEKNPFWQEPHDAVSIFFVHKPKVAEMVHLYQEDFTNVLQHEEVDGSSLLQAAKGKSFFNDVLKKHDGLIGTLFGFGRNNAWLFEKRKHDKSVHLSHIWEEEICEAQYNAPKGIYLKDLSLVVDYPTFAVDPNSSETKQLRKTFLKVRRQIIDYYQGKDFLEATLNLLLETPRETIITASS